MIYNTKKVNKLDLKFRKYIFLGYIEEAKGHYLWDFTVHKVVSIKM